MYTSPQSPPDLPLKSLKLLQPISDFKAKCTEFYGTEFYGLHPKYRPVDLGVRLAGGQVRVVGADLKVRGPSSERSETSRIEVRMVESGVEFLWMAASSSPEAEDREGGR